ncbi:GNAT family N-acetyltransferase [Legionella pneumophila]|uniref:GNAT family N-acetyltransferase n=1 Tax=Legionella pneumophila TaxID=446 RepID=UPI003A4C7A6D
MIKIDLLKDHQDSIPRLATIWHEVFGKIWVPDVPIEQVIKKYDSHLNDTQLPITFVATDGEMPVGMCSLRENDGIRPDLTPWLGSLVVSPAYQKKGIAPLLIETTQQKAKDLGFKKIYLFAFDPTIPDYYSRLGWSVIGIDEFKGHTVTVMEFHL